MARAVRNSDSERERFVIHDSKERYDKTINNIPFAEINFGRHYAGHVTAGAAIEQQTLQRGKQENLRAMAS